LRSSETLAAKIKQESCMSWVPKLLLLLGAAGAAFLLEQPLLLYIVLLAISLYAYALLNDLQRVRSILKNAGKTEKNSSRRIRRNNHCQTGAGSAAMLEAEALQHRLNFLLSDLSTNELNSSGKNHTELIDLIKNSRTEDSFDESRLFNDLLEFLSLRCRSEASAILLGDKTTSLEEPAFLRGIQGKRFVKQLRDFFRPYFKQNDSSYLGFHDARMSDTLLGAFPIFGIRYTVSFPFSWETEEGQRNGVLWFGYSENTPPGELEIKWLENISKKIETELESYYKLCRMSEKITLAEKLSKERSDFITHISHDIRSPLNNIKAILNVLALENDPEEARELLDVAQKNCEGMGELVEDVLDYSKHRAGELKARTRVFSLSSCLLDTADAYKVAARLKGINFQVKDLPGDCYIQADQRHIKRIISNLISNAVKYTKHDSVSIWIEEKDSRWALIIKDTGCGMSPEQLQILFTPFTRFAESSIDGIGLGLTLSKILLELNSGAISVKSELGKGSEFEISFPVAEALAREEQKQAELFSRPKSPLLPDTAQQFQNIKVLIVDDDPDCVTSLAKTLQIKGCNVLQATTVHDAISLFNFGIPDILITDSQMPDGGGRRLVEYVQTKKFASTVFVLSGSENQETISDYQRLGAAKVFSKPIDLDALLLSMQKVLKRTALPAQKKVAAG